MAVVAMTSQRRLYLTTAGSMLTGAWGQGTLVVSGVLIARILGPENRGYLALFVLYPTVLTVLGGLGFPAALPFFIGGDKQAAAAVVRRISPLAAAQILALVLLHGLILWVFLIHRPSDLRIAALITLAAVPSILGLEYGLSILQGQHRYTHLNLLRATPSTLFSAAVLVLFVGHLGNLTTVALAWVGSYGVALAASLLTVRRGLGRGVPTPNTDRAAPTRWQIARFGLTGLLGSVSLVDTFRLDQAIVGLLLSPLALGLYVVALAFTNLPRFMAQSIGLIAYPQIAAESRSSARRSVWGFFALTLGVATLLSAGLFVVVGSLIPLLFGANFAAAVPVARILLVATVFLSGRRVLADAARGLGFPSLGSIGEVTSWLFLFPLLFALGARYGLLGVAAAVTAASAVGMVVLWALVWSKLKTTSRGV
jgi:O-antigen/teichoic acid export membrane protein